MGALDQHFPADYAAVDIETTGLDVATCHVIEIGVVTCVNGRVATASILVKGATVPQEVVSLTGITDEMLEQEGVSPGNAILWLMGRTGNLPLVGHNCLKYDAPIIARFSGEPVEYAIDRWRDTMALFKGLKMGYYFRDEDTSHVKGANGGLDQRVYGLKTNLRLACEELGIEREKTVQHRAGTDAALTQKLFEKLRAKYTTNANTN